MREKYKGSFGGWMWRGKKERDGPVGSILSLPSSSDASLRLSPLCSRAASNPPGQCRDGGPPSLRRDIPVAASYDDSLMHVARGRSHRRQAVLLGRATPRALSRKSPRSNERKGSSFLRLHIAGPVTSSSSTRTSTCDLYSSVIQPRPATDISFTDLSRPSDQYFLCRSRR